MQANSRLQVSAIINIIRQGKVWRSNIKNRVWVRKITYYRLNMDRNPWQPPGMLLTLIRNILRQQAPAANLAI